MGGLRQRRDGDTDRDDPECLEGLEAFCLLDGKVPDTIISECVLIRDGEKRIRAKGRRRYADLIAEF